MLNLNPEFYTVWNYRRNILINGIFPACSPAEKHETLSNDLSMTTAALKAHPKVYWIWNHRRWCLENLPDGGEGDDPQAWRRSSWERELFIVDKMFDRDPRNFHVWNYRRYVLSNMPVPRTAASELAFTTKMIESKLSNFSAWHHRTKVFSSLRTSSELDIHHYLPNEFEIVHNALYTEPNDQGVWLYHRWLMGTGEDRQLLEREIGVIQELLCEEPSNKWCMESLVRYKQMLLQNHSSTLGNSEAQNLVRQCLDLLRKLEELDPARRQRYQDLAAEVKT
ncbi:rab-protein geranylgeranyltransferase [Auriscalpium vulgare]|uniref:Rab-protein geranylgeranyltransferase n=1 Tax=Auriscalpium vulgare TaxID=40419 RepID=A0ACB8RVJ6_9AGAM|nr:rab-protein geranylgeranyltransferase [Auriscalpium vulgare]